MERLQSLAILLAVVAVAFGPWVYSKARRRDEGEDEAVMSMALRRRLARAQELSQVVARGDREELAWYLYGETHAWNRRDMLDYDNFPVVREPWIAEADLRLLHSRRA